MPVTSQDKYTGHYATKEPKRNDPGLGLACDVSEWFNVAEFLKRFSTRKHYDRRPLGAAFDITFSDFVAMIALNQGDAGNGGKARF
eukprot:1471506-Alexandrium_andersonii.AAC.1